MPLQHWLASVYVNLEWLALGTALLVALSALDDAVIDVWYWWLRFQRNRIIRRQQFKPLTVSQLKERPEQPIAIMVPAWKEYDVIAQMIAGLVATMEYKNYVIFVGTYCNDSATAQEVDRMRRRYRQLRRVEVPNPGPTCKADCLNWVVQDIFLYEKEYGVQFAGMVLHDSEDVVHPLELAFFNYLLPRKDMIQLPVMSLERHWYELVAGTYMDEFAESHAKDMLVREQAAGVVPSAGVGTCFSRKALNALCQETQNQPFNVSSLTEDYDIGNRLGRMGMASMFGLFPVEYLIKPLHDPLGAPVKRMLPLGVREFFPDTFVTAYRQKARWTLGIGLQSWDQIRISGNLAARYLLLRDRKGVATALVSVLAYLSMIGFIVFHLLGVMGIWTVYYPSVFELNSWTLEIMVWNFGSLVNRAAHRYYFVTQLYGWRQGLWSLPRMIVGNFVNFMAVARAWHLYLAYLFQGKRLVWDKTMHDFPSSDTLASQKHRLGELLLTWQAVDTAQLDAALKQQGQNALPLGRIMVLNGWLDEETLAEAISCQSHIPRAVIDLNEFGDSSKLLSHEICIRYRVLPLGIDDSGHLLLGVEGPLTDAEMDAIQVASGRMPALRVVRGAEMAAGLRSLGFGQLSGGRADTPLLGDLLIQGGFISRCRFEQAVEGYRPQLHGQMGAYLIQRGVIDDGAFERVLALQRGMATGQVPTAEVSIQ